MWEGGIEIHSRPKLKYGFHLADFYELQNHSKSRHEHLLHHSRSKSHMQHIILHLRNYCYLHCVDKYFTHELYILMEPILYHA